MRQFNPDTDCILVVDNHHGVYIPSEFCKHYRSELEAAGFSEEVQSIISMADWEDYDWSWDIIEGNYLHQEYGREWVLMYGPCGDLFLVATDVELPDWE